MAGVFGRAGLAHPFVQHSSGRGTRNRHLAALQEVLARIAERHPKSGGRLEERAVEQGDEADER